MALRKKCPYSELFWSAFFHSRTEYGEMLRIFPNSVRMLESTDQNNSEYGHFSRTVDHSFSTTYARISEKLTLLTPRYTH